MVLGEFEANGFVYLYLLEIYLWPFTLVTLALEILVIAQFMPGTRWWKLSAIVFGANVLSSVLGFGIISLLPDGRGFGISEVSNAVIFVAIALLISIVFETAFVGLFMWTFQPEVVFKAVTFANIVSYTSIILIVPFFMLLRYVLNSGWF